MTCYTVILIKATLYFTISFYIKKKVIINIRELLFVYWLKLGVGQLMSNSDVKYKIIDLFAGAGGLSNGFLQTGKFDILGAVEINAAAVKTYIKNHGHDEKIIIRTKNTGESDITNINFEDFKEEKGIHDENQIIVIGGPPCQGFSNANRQKNYLISGNNQLVKEYVRAILQVNPVAFLMENVKTMDSAKHKFFITKSDGVYLSKYYLGSEEHMNDLLDKAGEDIAPFWTEERITLIETDNAEIKKILYNFLQNENIKIMPFLSQGFQLRLKGIIRRFHKNGNDELIKNDKEKKEFANLKNHIQNYKNNEEHFRGMLLIGAEGLFSRVEDILHKLLDGIVLSEKDMDNLDSFLVLNKWLLIFKELNDERIDFTISYSEDMGTEDDAFKIEALVKTYNIVVYLKYIFKSLGYQIDAGVLTASNYGVPQKRNRFMILGVKNSSMKTKEVKLPEGYRTRFSTRDAILDLETIPPAKEVSSQPLVYDVSLGKTLLQKYYRKNAGNNLLNHINTSSKDLSLKRFQKIKDGNGKNFHSLSDELKESYADASRTQNTVYLRLNYEEPSPTVVNVRKSMWNHPKNAVAISIREAARLQSFRDDFEFIGTKDQQYQQVGNAVPPLMARAVAEKILEVLGDKPVVSLEEELELLESLSIK